MESRSLGIGCAVVLAMLGVHTTRAGEAETEAPSKAALQQELREIYRKMWPLQQKLHKENPEVVELSKQIRKLQKELRENMTAALPELVQLQARRKEILAKLRRKLQEKMTAASPELAQLQARRKEILAKLRLHSANAAGTSGRWKGKKEAAE